MPHAKRVSIPTLSVESFKLSQTFSLRYVKKIEIRTCSVLPWEINNGVFEFYKQCVSARGRMLRGSPSLNIPIDMEWDDSYQLPSVLIEYEDGRTINVENAAGFHYSMFMELMFYKRQAIKRYQRMLGEEVDESDVEDELKYFDDL